MARERKICNRCGLNLPVAEFHRRAKSRDGLAGECRQCAAERFAEYMARPGVRERMARQKRAYRRTPAGAAAYRRGRERHAARHPEQIRAKNRRAAARYRRRNRALLRWKDRLRSHGTRYVRAARAMAPWLEA